MLDDRLGSGEQALIAPVVEIFVCGSLLNSTAL